MSSPSCPGFLPCAIGDLCMHCGAAPWHHPIEAERMALRRIAFSHDPAAEIFAADLCFALAMRRIGSPIAGWLMQRLRDYKPKDWKGRSVIFERNAMAYLRAVERRGIDPQLTIGAAA